MSAEGPAKWCGILTGSERSGEPDNYAFSRLRPPRAVRSEHLHPVERETTRMSPRPSELDQQTQLALVHSALEAMDWYDRMMFLRWLADSAPEIMLIRIEAWRTSTSSVDGWDQGV